MGIGIVGVGHQLSGREETNEELCALLPDTTPEWIVEKTGITRRYLATEDETASGMAIAAARRALEMAGISGQDVGLIIACTFSADYAFPPVSAKIQHELGAKGAQIFDLQANCAGFVSGLTVASDRMRADPEVRYAVVVGVELHTRFIDRTDVDTAIYFSDGAGATSRRGRASCPRRSTRTPPTTSRCGCGSAARPTRAPTASCPRTRSTSSRAAWRPGSRP
jgi:3-oxoacyl-[acyl-carrier-protein] synthase III